MTRWRCQLPTGVVGLALLTGCASDRISSELEFHAIGACGDAIEERRGEPLRPGWRYGLDLRDGDQVIDAWAPGRNTDASAPDYRCVVVEDPNAEAGVRVVRVHEGRP